MLGKQRKNQATGPKFMDAAWKNMAEILDQEMPVEKKERRIGWLSIAAILVMGFVGGITVMWGLQKHNSAPMAISLPMEVDDQNEVIYPNTNLKNEIVTTTTQKEAKPVLTPNNKVAYNSKITHQHQQKTIISDSGQKVHSVSSVNTQKRWIANNTNVSSTNAIGQDELSSKPVVQNTSEVMAIVESTSEKTIAAGSMISLNPSEKIEHPANPLSELPTLNIATLPTKQTNLTIDYDLDLPKTKKWRTGVYAGAVIAGKTGNGLEAAFRVERKLGAKWAVETGLGFRATQVAFLSQNDHTARETLDLNLGSQDYDPDNEDSLNLSGFERARIANRINVDERDYHLTVPFSLVYRPMGKLRLALGMSWAYRLNKLKDASSLDFDPVISSGDLANNSSFDGNSFSARFNDYRLNLGVGYQFNARTGIELAYSRRLNDNGINLENAGFFGDFASIADDASSPLSFFQLGWVYYFGG